MLRRAVLKLEKNEGSIGDAKKAIKEQGTSLEKGLTDAEASKRLERYGYNEIVEKKKNAIVLLARKFYGPIPFMLEVVIILTYFLKEFKDFYIILALLVFNGLVSFMEEKSADNSIELLKNRLRVSARVLRSGAWSIKPAKDIVPGDIIRLRMGDVVPADGVAATSDGLRADQSVLTGETMPSKKGIGDKVYSGSVITGGEGLCVVTATGYSTYYGRTTKLVQEAKPKLHLQTLIVDVVRYLIIMDLVLVTLLFIIATYLFGYSPIELLPFILVVVIASVPVALPAAFTVTMATGTEKLAAKSVLVTKLEAIEEASTVNVICFDKTGTITENKLEVKEVFVVNGASENDVMLAASLCSRRADNDPIDNAVLDYAAKLGIKTSDYEVKKFVPFQPKTKEASATVQHGGKRFTVSKGAVPVLLSDIQMDGKTVALLNRKTEEFSRNKFRTIAVSTYISGKPRIIGIIALYDKPRKDSKELIKELKSLGIRVKMLTGDDVNIAEEIAKEVGIEGKVMSVNELKGKTEGQVKDMIDRTEVFAEIYPDDKFTIVKALQDKGYRVSMTGDGVNDAPALKQAEVGIAVENATDVAKSVAAVVLEKSGVEVIVDMIKESRRIFERMMTYTITKITRVIQILFFIFIAFMLLRSMPILPFELILLIFTNDIVNISVATDHTKYSIKPDVWNVGSLINISLLLGISMLAVSLAFIPIARYLVLGLAAFQTFAFLMINVTDNILFYGIRARSRAFGIRPSSKLVAASIGGVLFGILISYYGIIVHPISASTILVLLVAAAAFMALFNVARVYIFKAHNV